MIPIVHWVRKSIFRVISTEAESASFRIPCSSSVPRRKAWAVRLHHIRVKFGEYWGKEDDMTISFV